MPDKVLPKVAHHPPDISVYFHAVVRDEILRAEYGHALAEDAAHQVALGLEGQRLLQKLAESNLAKRIARSALDGQNIKFLQLGVVPDISVRDGLPVKKD